MPAPLVLGGLAAAFGGIISALASRLFDFAYKFFAFKIARGLALGGTVVLVVAGLTTAMALAIKAIVVGARVTMPGSLGASTYFLPNNINFIIACYVSVRLTHFIWQWSVRNVDRIAQQSN